MSRDPEETFREPVDKPDAEAAAGRSGGRLLDGSAETLRRIADRERAHERYRLGEELARGGQGVVYTAFDEDLRRDLAMKVLRRQLGAAGDGPLAPDPRTLGRFLEEAQVTGQLDHPGIVPVHELGLDSEGRTYFTMKLVKGRDLREVFEQVRTGAEDWNLTRALGVLLKVCEAMAYAHAKGVIHRDLKPANVMVGRFGEVFVMDWGLARVMGEADTKDIRVQEGPRTTELRSSRRESAEEDDDSPLMTMDGDVVGTPAYMPPEQATGDLQSMGPASDVYSIGAILYQLLTGTVPYSPPGARMSNRAVWLAVQMGPPPPVQGLAPDVPGELVAICEKAMAREPGARYADTSGLAEDLRAFLEGRVVGAYETGAVAELRKWVRRNRGLAASLALTLLVAIAGLGATVWVQTRGKQRLEQVNTALSLSKAEADDARRAAEENEAAARANEERALESERAARWQSYVANIGAANARMEAGSVGDAARRLEACPEEYRESWEWRYLANRVDASLARAAHGDTFVLDVAFSPDGRHVASAGGSGESSDYGSDDYSVRIWTVDQGTDALELLHVLPPHQERVHAIAFSPSGTELVSASMRYANPSTGRVVPGELRVWDVATGEELAALACEVPREGFTWISPISIAYHPDHRQLKIAVGSQSAIWEWDLATDELRRILTPGVATTALDYLPGVGAGRPRMAAGLIDGRVLLLDPAGRAEPEVTAVDLADHGQIDFALPFALDLPSKILDLDWSRDGGRLIVATTSGELVLIDAATSEVAGVLRGHGRAATSVRFGAGSRTAVSSSLDGTLRVWDLETFGCMEVLHGHEGLVRSLDVGPDGHRVVSGSSDQTVRIWDAQSGSCTNTWPSAGWDNFQRYTLCFDPTGQRLAWRPAPLRLRVTDLESGLDLFTLPDLPSMPKGVTFEPDGAALITVAPGVPVQRWSAVDGALLSTAERALPPAMWYAHFDVDRTRFAATFLDGGEPRVQVRDARTGAVIEGCDWPHVASFSVRFTPDGRRVVAGGRDGSITIFDLDGDQAPRPFAPSLPHQVLKLAVSPDGARVAATSYLPEDRTLWLFDLERGELTARLEGHAKPAVVAFSPGGGRIVTGNWDDGTVSLWAPDHGELLSLHGHRDTIRAVAFSPDGNRLVAVESDGTHRVWETVPVRERADARHRAAIDRGQAASLQPLVDSLFEEHLLPGRVIAALQARSDLPPDRLETAVRLALNQAIPTPRELWLEAWNASWPAGQSAAQYERALRASETALLLEPDGAWSPHAANTKGYSLYRLARYEEAFDVLVELSERNARTEPPPYERFYDLVMLAMVEHRLGRGEDARATLARAGSSLSGPAVGNMATLLLEAQFLLQGD